MNGTVWWLDFLWNIGGGEKLFIYLEWCFVLRHSFSSLYVVPDFPSMLFSYYFTTSLPLPLHILSQSSVHWYIGLVIPVLGCEFSGHHLNSRRLSYTMVTKEYVENLPKFSCKVGATQRNGIFLPVRFRKSMQWCEFCICNSFQYGRCNGSPPFLSRRHVTRAW
jgi:hypothetical protein